MTASGWVIEAAGPLYWTGHKANSEAFSRDHHDAVRFAREIDANSVLSWCFPIEVQRLVVVRQHMWIDGEPASGGAS